MSKAIKLLLKRKIKDETMIKTRELSKKFNERLQVVWKVHQEKS